MQPPCIEEAVDRFPVYDELAAFSVDTFSVDVAFVNEFGHCFAADTPGVLAGIIHIQPPGSTIVDVGSEHVEQSSCQHVQFVTV